MDDLVATELVPFKALVSPNHDIASIMTAHISLPDAYGNDVPASLAPETIKLLREKLNYNRVVVTDCLEMEAVVQYCGTPSGAVRALRSGADIAMICHRYERQVGAIELTYQELEAGKFSESEWEASAKRIANLKDSFAGSWSDVFARSVPKEQLANLLKEHAILSRHAYAASTTLVRDRGKCIPLSVKLATKERPILLFTPKPESLNLAVDDPTEEGVLRTSDNLIRNTAGPSYNSFAKSIAKRSEFTYHTVYHSNYDPMEAQSAVENSSVVIFVLRSADRSPWVQKILNVVSRLTKEKGIPLFLISSYTPYDLLETGTEYSDLTYICTFEFTPLALEAAAAVVFGEEKAQGKLPVRN